MSQTGNLVSHCENHFVCNGKNGIFPNLVSTSFYIKHWPNLGTHFNSPLVSISNWESVEAIWSSQTRQVKKTKKLHNWCLSPTSYERITQYLILQVQYSQQASWSFTLSLNKKVTRNYLKKFFKQNFKLHFFLKLITAKIYVIKNWIVII